MTHRLRSLAFGGRSGRCTPSRKTFYRCDERRTCLQRIGNAIASAVNVSRCACSLASRPVPNTVLSVAERVLLLPGRFGWASASGQQLRDQGPSTRAFLWLSTRRSRVGRGSTRRSARCRGSFERPGRTDCVLAETGYPRTNATAHVVVPVPESWPCTNASQTMKAL